jgi:hypothetical protein
MNEGKEDFWLWAARQPITSERIVALMLGLVREEDKTDLDREFLTKHKEFSH